jgi:hypothetical protein
MGKFKKVYTNRKVQLAFLGLVAAIASVFGLDITGIVSVFGSEVVAPVVIE